MKLFLQAEVTDVLIVPVWQKEKLPPILSVVPSEKFSGEKNELWWSMLSDGKILLAVGLGEFKSATAVQVSAILANAVKVVQEKKINQPTIYWTEKLSKLQTPLIWGELLSRDIGVATYQFTEYISDPKRHWPKIISVGWQNSPRSAAKKFTQGWQRGVVVAETINLARDLGNHPGGTLYPEKLGAEAERAAAQLSKVHVRVLHQAEIMREKMGGLLGVSAGAAQPPVFIVMEYAGGRKKDAPVVLVGKGLTFDAGGISLKPGEKMDEMKMDMLGGAAVIATVVAAAKLKLPINLVGLVPASENLPSGGALKPGDILRSFGGKTIEVLNTDAEGRIILADALGYAAKYNPAAVIDVATLTGACAVALGETYAGFWTNDEKLARRLLGAAELSGEKIWRLPLGEEFTKQTKSNIADVKNIGERYGAANSSAAFLQEFVDYPWAHLDITGVAWSQKLQPERRPGAAGWGVALLLQLIRR